MIRERSGISDYYSIEQKILPMFSTSNIWHCVFLKFHKFTYRQLIRSFSEQYNRFQHFEWEYATFDGRSAQRVTRSAELMKLQKKEADMFPPIYRFLYCREDNLVYISRYFEGNMSQPVHTSVHFIAHGYHPACLAHTDPRLWYLIAPWLGILTLPFLTW